MSHTNNKLRAMLRLVALVCGLSMVLSACSGSSSDGGSGGSSSGKKLVYFMAPNTTPTRYLQQDGPDFKKALEKLDPNVEVKFVTADGTSATQLTQANAAISAGAKALVMVAADPNTSSSILAAATKANVPVIGYENPPLNGPMYAQVIFDPKAVGVEQATYFASQVESGALGAKPVRVARLYGNKGDVYTTNMLAGQDSILKPLITDGSIDVVCASYVKNWDPAVAQTEADQCLTKTQNNVGAFLGFYDGITAGIIASLKAKNVKVPVYGGQNPELTGPQYMLTGDQQDTVLKAFSVEADAAAKIVKAALDGDKPPADLVKDTTNNGGADVPTANLPSELIHLEKGKDPGEVVQKVVDLGIFTWKEICTGPAKDTATCKEKVG